MAPHRDDRVEEPAGLREERRATRTTQLALGTLACPGCDAPVALAGAVSPADALWCPFCDRGGAVREFLSLASPPRTPVVSVRVLTRTASRLG